MTGIHDFQCGWNELEDLLPKIRAIRSAIDVHFNKHNFSVGESEIAAAEQNENGHGHHQVSSITNVPQTTCSNTSRLDKQLESSSLSNTFNLLQITESSSHSELDSDHACLICGIPTGFTNDDKRNLLRSSNSFPQPSFRHVRRQLFQATTFIGEPINRSVLLSPIPGAVTHEHLFVDQNDAGAATQALYCKGGNDSIDGSPEKNHTHKLHLPSRKQKVISPSEKYEKIKFPRRRKNKKWSLHEAETLRTAVEKFGTGHWKFILNIHHDTFVERTEVDLKDKWRNMTRRA